MIEVDLGTKALWKMAEITIVSIVGDVRDMLGPHPL
jgi:hypothetical protein